MTGKVSVRPQKTGREDKKMKILCTSTGLVWYKRPEKGIWGVRKGGFEEILLDISTCCSAGELEYFGEERKVSGGVLHQKAEEAIRISEHPEELCGSLKRLFDECGKESQHTGGPGTISEQKHKERRFGRTVDAACKGEHQSLRRSGLSLSDCKTAFCRSRARR